MKFILNINKIKRLSKVIYLIKIIKNLGQVKLKGGLRKVFIKVIIVDRKENR